MSFNKAILIGRLTRDAELRYTPNGRPVMSFGLAVDRWGSKEKEADFFDIDVWGQTAEAISKYATKGKMVAVDGRIQIDRYEKDGQQRKAYKIVANDVRLLGGGRRDDEGPPSGSYEPRPQQPQAMVPHAGSLQHDPGNGGGAPTRTGNEPGDKGLEDDLPF